MGLVYVEIELINGNDLAMVCRKIIGEDEIKSMRVTALLDRGSFNLAINENLQEQLQLAVVDKRKAQLADGSIIECKVVAPVELRFKDRSETCSAVVLPKDFKSQINVALLNDAPIKIPYYRLL